MTDTLQMDVHVLDADICKHCKDLKIDDSLTSYLSGFETIFTEHILRCRHLSECEYRRNLFASSTTPNMET